MIDDRHRAIRLELFEVYEDGADFPLFVTSDASEIASHRHFYPEDTVVRRFWVREGSCA